MSSCDIPRALFTTRQFSEQHPAFSPANLRYLAFHSEPRGKTPANGFAPAFLRLGRKILIDEARFLEVLDRLNCREQGG
jgi:hypothetical protein